jgi:hypothetical protein
MAMSERATFEGRVCCVATSGVMKSRNCTGGTAARVLFDSVTLGNS